MDMKTFTSHAHWKSFQRGSIRVPLIRCRSAYLLISYGKEHRDDLGLKFSSESSSASIVLFARHLGADG